MKLTKEKLGEALYGHKKALAVIALELPISVHNDYCGKVALLEEAAQRLLDNWDALEELHKAGKKATQGEYRIRENGEDFFLEAEKTQPHHPYCIEVLSDDVYPDDEDDGDIVYTVSQKRGHAEFFKVAANNRHAIRNLIGGDDE